MPPSQGHPQPPVQSAAIRELIERRPVFDAHADSIGRALDLGHDLGEQGDSGHLDLIRGAQGGLGTWVVVCWVDPEQFKGMAYRRASAMIEATHRLEQQRPDQFRLVGNLRELRLARDAGCVAGVLGIEGGHAIEEDLGKLHSFFESGLRVMTLVWNNHLSWIRSCQPGAGADVPLGLSEFGREVVAEMNYLGILVDLSHASETAFYDALSTGAVAPIASHSGCRSLHDHPRNLTDGQLKHLASVGGVVGIVFHPGFLSAAARAEETRVRRLPAYKNLSNEDAAQLFLEQQELMREQAEPMAASLLVDHVMHAVEVAGIDHVGIGSDYDGIERGPQWMEDARGYAVLAQLLSDRGLSIPEIEKILGGNMERVFDAATGMGSLAHSSLESSLA